MRAVGRCQVALVAAGVALACALGGCDTEAFKGPIEISRSDEGLIIAVCRDTRAIEIYASWTNRDAQAPWTRFWELDGLAEFERGDLVRVGETVNGMTTRLFEAPEISEGTEIAFTIVGDAGAGDIAADFFLDGQLDEGVWLDAQGLRAAVPCSDDATGR